MTEQEREYIAEISIKNLCLLLDAKSSTVITLDSSGKSTKKIIITLPND
jgi:hypothetical protein